jgi:hypothetical protein
VCSKSNLADNQSANRANSSQPGAQPQDTDANRAWSAEGADQSDPIIEPTHGDLFFCVDF